MRRAEVSIRGAPELMSTRRPSMTKARARNLLALIARDLPRFRLGDAWTENTGSSEGWIVAVRWRGETYRVHSQAEWWKIRGGDPRA